MVDGSEDGTPAGSPEASTDRQTTTERTDVGVVPPGEEPAGSTPESSAAETGTGIEAERPDAHDTALARQQLFVGSGVAVLSGLAVVVGGTQQFPDVPFLAVLAVGLFTTGLLFALLSASIFRDGTG
jgi:hypothetical protein